MENQAKRHRKANFTDTEIRVLLEEISVDHKTLFMANNQTVTNRLKGDIWKRITAKISACGVAERTPQEAKEKWRSLKGAVLNKQKRQTKTGGGPPDKPVPYEDIIVTIIGENSNLYTGIEVQGTDTYENPQTQAVECKNNTENTCVVSSEPTPHCSKEYPEDLTSVQTISGPPTSSLTLTPLLNVDTTLCQDDDNIAVAIVNESKTFEAKQSASPSLDKILITKSKAQNRKIKRKSLVEKGLDDHENDLFEEYLKSEIEKNKAMTIFFNNKNKKILLGIKKLEKIEKEDELHN
ncbi:uncharacterized protein LOC121369454 [Gigantopelta aegis]|uniref:uncharacterized protein LOC121369454 n=1 Tax=Gigantopelta aegis TaxID=1735272 RepID=UPI001B887A26|nr:uncharacterized protein LOC121369454 [Gigantopelta aegis]